MEKKRKMTKKNDSKKPVPLASLNENDRTCRAIGQRLSRDEPPIGARRERETAQDARIADNQT